MSDAPFVHFHCPPYSTEFKPEVCLDELSVYWTELHRKELPRDLGPMFRPDKYQIRGRLYIGEILAGWIPGWWVPNEPPLHVPYRQPTWWQDD